jgi:DNA-binding IclR family transcriptional regulator
MDKTLAKGLTVLEALVRSEGPCGVSDLAASLGMSKSNAHRLLNTLVDTGFVMSANGRYSPTLKVWELGARIIRTYDVRALARPAMTRLVRETAESVRLSVLDPDHLEVVWIDKIDSPQDVRPFSELGGRVPAWCTSSGKALLAYQSDEVIARVSRKLKARTKHTLVDRQAFIRELKKVKTDGYAYNDRGFTPLVRGVSAPIFGTEDEPVASLTVVAPAERMPQPVLKKFAALVCEAAAAVSAQMRPAPREPVQSTRGDTKQRKLSA